MLAQYSNIQKYGLQGEDKQLEEFCGQRIFD